MSRDEVGLDELLTMVETMDAPALRAALTAYHASGDAKYVTYAEDVAYYLATWQWHYTVAFPEGSLAREIGSL